MGAAAPVGRKAGRVARLYLIEDDEGVRQQLTLLLQGAGHEVMVPDGFEMLGAKVAAADPDLVVLDLGLPGTDGQYVAREIRQVSDVPIMVLTCRSSELDELMSLTVGADDFVAKSTNPQLILAHVDALLRRSGKNAADHVVRVRFGDDLPAGPAAWEEDGVRCAVHCYPRASDEPRYWAD